MKRKNAFIARNVKMKQKTNEMAIFARNRAMKMNNHEGK